MAADSSSSGTFSVPGRTTAVFVERVPAEEINDSLDLGALSTAYNPPPQPQAPAGVFTISATFSNVSSSELVGLYFKVVPHTGGATVCIEHEVAAGVGAEVSVPPGALGPNGILNPGESFVMDFEIGLQERPGFSFLVDAYGIPLNGGASGLTVQTPAEDGFRFEVVERQLTADTQSLYMPVILKE